MLHKKHLAIFALFIILIICISQKCILKKKGFFLIKKIVKLILKKIKN